MASSRGPQANPGLFVPTTNLWDVSQITHLEGESPQLRELLVRLYQNLNLVSTALNLKDSGYYDLQEFLNGQLFFPNPVNPSNPSQPVYRQAFRTVVNFGALPNTGTKSVAHGIPIASGYTFTRLYGAATDPSALSFIPLPYASPTLASNIELRADATNVIVTTGSARSSFTATYIVLEYIKQ
jgi:hypothetical protein